MKSIGEQIKAQREAREMTADALGRAVGRDRQAVYSWEAGRSTPSGDVLLKLVGMGFVAIPAEDAA